MSSKSYKSSLNNLLIPLGFVNNNKTWIRENKEFVDEIELQYSAKTHRTTSNLRTKDSNTEKILIDLLGSSFNSFMYPVDFRIGDFLGPYSIWWTIETNGPEEITKILSEHALPFLDQMRDLEYQAKRFGRGRSWKWGGWTHQLYLVVTLYRMGEIAEACEVLNQPTTKLNDTNKDILDKLRNRFGC